MNLLLMLVATTEATDSHIPKGQKQKKGNEH